MLDEAADARRYNWKKTPLEGIKWHKMWGELTNTDGNYNYEIDMQKDIIEVRIIQK
jgi:hypothetical protein